MIRVDKILFPCLLAVGFVVLPGLPARADGAAVKPEAKPADAAGDQRAVGQTPTRAFARPGRSARSCSRRVGHAPETNL